MVEFWTANGCILHGKKYKRNYKPIDQFLPADAPFLLSGRFVFRVIAYYFQESI